MVNARSTNGLRSDALATQETSQNSLWGSTVVRFLAAVAGCHRHSVSQRLQQVHSAGSGLRDWVDAIAWRGAVLPDHIPEAVIEVYLTDPEASPLYDCEGCGMAVPVRPSRLYGFEGEPEEVYFPTCPACGSRTGLFSHFTRRFEDKTNPLRRVPR
jgi:hypothetical protein